VPVTPTWRERLAALPDREGSTRVAALLRIAIAILVLVRFADGMMFRDGKDPVALAIVAAFWPAVLAMLFGFHARIAAGLTAAALIAGRAYLDGTNVGWGWNHHHVYLLLAATTLIAFAPCGRSYSLDRWRAVQDAAARGAPPPAERGPTWAVTLIAVQVTAVYLWGAFDKTTVSWLSGDKIESQLLFYTFDSDPPDLPGWRLLVLALAIGTVVTEYALAIGLWFARTRRVLVPIGIGFHVFVYMSVPVSVFSALTTALYLAYLDPDAVHRAIDRLGGDKLAA
jgi:hypothetical protein